MGKNLVREQMNWFCAAALSLTMGCDNSSGLSAPKPLDSGASDRAVAQAVDQGADQRGAGQLFDKSLRKKACDILTPVMVSKMFSVPEPELKQMKIMGCIYSWSEKSGNQTLEARFSTIMVQKDEERAKQWFANATKSLSEEEAKKQMAMITNRTKEHKDIDTELKKATADQLGGLLAQHAQGGITYEKLSGVGDEAALNLSDGNIWVRVRNMTFVIGGYQGPEMPQPDLKGLDLKKIAAASMTAQKEWVQKTMQQRKAAGLKVAKAVIEELP